MSMSLFVVGYRCLLFVAVYCLLSGFAVVARCIELESVVVAADWYCYLLCVVV